MSIFILIRVQNFSAQEQYICSIANVKRRMGKSDPLNSCRYAIN